MGRITNKIFSNAIPCRHVYAVRVFAVDSEMEDVDDYMVWIYYNFSEAWFAFCTLVDCTEAEFRGGRINEDGHFYFALAEDTAIQLTPFFTFPDEDGYQ